VLLGYCFRLTFSDMNTLQMTYQKTSDKNSSTKAQDNLDVEESIRMTEDRDKWGKYIDGVANHRTEDGYGMEHLRSPTVCCR